MSNSTTAIRLTRTPEVERVLKLARKRYPVLDDPAIFKLALGHLVQNSSSSDTAADFNELEATATEAVGSDYLSDPKEDLYHLGMGKRIKLD